MMSTVFFINCVGMGAAVFHDAAFENAQAARVELGPAGDTETDLTPEEMRQRMWWAQFMVNMGAKFQVFGLYDHLKDLPETRDGLGEWIELPDHLQ
jgi:hypothetical protein